MFRLFPLLLAGFAVLTLSACQTTNGQRFSDASPQLVATPDSVSAMLADAADRATSALETLAAVEQHRSPSVAVAPIGNAPIELRRAVTVSWVGPVEPIAKMLAERVSYNFLVIGAAPSVPVVISLDAENSPTIDVLRDIGLQLGNRADVYVDAERKVVEIRYTPTTSWGG